MAPPSTTLVQDHVALAEIELCGDLIIAASAAEEPLSFARIDEVLKVAAERPGAGAPGRRPPPALTGTRRGR
ncbi:hypothetical protein ABT354_34725 [Streptomyces sp. NPDC000594]|uniref:hypothetical protein n=1 Tax=Streptomyces sp. NPDC000594 TaxID=3154261 RepID=UPI003333B8FF